MDTGRVVLVTGSAGSIGSALVDAFVANGDEVVASDRDTGSLWRRNARVAVQADITRERDCAALADVVRAEFGHLDVLVNCAGWYPATPFQAMTGEHWRAVIDVNLTGTAMVTAAALPLIADRGWGRIVNIGSASVFAGVAEQTHYVAAKAGVVGLTRSLAREVGHLGITVNVVAPGLTITPAVLATYPAELLEAQRRARALARDQQPSDVVGPVLFLASDAAGFITGQTLTVDGGRNMA